MMRYLSFFAKVSMSSMSCQSFEGATIACGERCSLRTARQARTLDKEQPNVEQKAHFPGGAYQ